MIRIGVLGDIGSGKSFVAKQFGYPVFNADNEVNELYGNNRKCFFKLKRKFPDYIKSFPIKKDNILKVVLANKNNLKKITKIIHPEIYLRMRKFINKNKSKKIIILDIPLLLENKINKKNDILIFIDAPKKQIDKRIKKRKNYNFHVFENLKKIQLPLEIKKKKSDFVIKNTFRNKPVKKSVKNILEKILLYA
tara:strand:+ start:159 stop:737 length:579 start_codon:yes stop_codon:yes gene_type:complete